MPQPMDSAGFSIYRQVQLVSVACNAGIDTSLATKLPDYRVQNARIAPHYRRSTMREDGVAYPGLRTPTELLSY